MKGKTVIRRCLALLLAFVMVVSGLSIPKGEAKVAKAAEETESATNIVGNTTADDNTAEAKIGEAYFKTFVDALNKANEVGNVTIELLQNVNISNASITKKLTIDGGGHEVTTTGSADTFKVEVADVVELKNMNINYQSTAVAIRIVDQATVAGADVRLTKVNIASTANVGWTLINILPQSKDVTTKLTLDTVNITMDTESGGALGRAIIRTGNGNNKVSITAKDSVLDTSPDAETKRTGAVLRHAIAVVNGTEAEINLTDTELHTLNALPIYDASNAAKIHKTRCGMSIASTENLKHISASTGEEEAFSATPVAQIGNTLYSEFTGNTGALAAANDSAKDVTIDLLAALTIGDDTTLGKTDYAILNNTSGKSITIDGNNHAVATKVKHAFSIRYSGVVNFRNMDITHYGQQSLFQVGESDSAENVATLNVDDVKVGVTIGSDASIGRYGLIIVPTKGKATLNLTRFDVTMNDVIDDVHTLQHKFVANDSGIIRSGNDATQEKEFSITLNDCTWNVSGVLNRHAILLRNNAKADIVINDSRITTSTGLPVYDNDTFSYTIHKTGSTFTSITNVAYKGNTGYTTFESAYSNAQDKDTIELLQDITFTEQFKLAKGITIDGNNHTVNTRVAHAIRIQYAGAVGLCNMKINHEAQQTAVLVEVAAQLTMTDVDIEVNSTNTEYFKYGIINVPATGTGIKLDFTRVDVKMKTGTFGANSHAVLRTGNDTDNSKEITITLTDCNWNVTEADHRIGIMVMKPTKATIVLNNTTINTLNAQPIYVHTESTETTVALEKGSKIRGANSVAQSGYTVYDTLAEALTAVKDSTNDVTIELLKDSESETCTILNAYGKNITINGNGYTLTTIGTGHAFNIYGSPEGNGTYEFKNMNVIHKTPRTLVQMTEQKTDGVVTHTTKRAVVKFTNVDIINKENGGHLYGLINALPTGDKDDVNMTLDLNNVDITMKFDSDELNTDDNAAIIRTGNDGEKTVNINLKDCNLNAAGASEIRGIHVLDSATSNIVLDNTNIATNNMAAIEAKEGATDSTITMTGTCTFDSEENEFKSSPIRGYDAQIGNTIYYSFKTALTEANKSTKAITVKLLNDVSFDTFTFNNATEGFAVTIDGDNPNSEENYTITTTGGTTTNAFGIGYPGEFVLKNLDIKHKNSGSVLQIIDTATVNVLNVNIDATEPSNQATTGGKTYYDTYTYALINVNHKDKEGVTTLNFNNVDIDMVAQAGASGPAILRTGNNNEAKNVDITLTNCNWDAGTLTVKQTITTEETTEVEKEITGATGRAGIRIMLGTSGTVKVIDSVITTLDEAPIYNSAVGTTVVTKTGDWKLNCVQKPAQVNTTVFGDFADAIKNAQDANSDVSFELLQDVTINTWDIHSLNGYNVTVDGNNHVITTAEEKDADNDNAFRIYGSSIEKGTGTYELKNMDIIHTKPGVLVQVNANTKYSAKNAIINLSNIDITTKKVNNDETVAYGGYLYGLVTILPATTSEDAGMTMNFNDVDVVMDIPDDVLHTRDDKAIIRTGNPGAGNEKKVQVNLVDCNWDIQKASKVSGIVVMDTTSATISMVNSEIMTKDIYAIKVNNETGLIAYTLDNTLLTSATETYAKHPVYNTDGHKILSSVYSDFATYRAETYKDDTYKANGGTLYFENNGEDAPLYKKPENIINGSLFGGWYTNANLSGAKKLTDIESEDPVYAKLVPHHVMNVKAQISKNLIDGDDTNNSTGTIRFVTTVDSTAYQEMGFRYSIVDDTYGLIQSGINSSDKVYTEIYALEENGGVMSYLPSVFCTESTYFKTLIIENIPAAFFKSKITVQPFWITLDGTIVWGEEVTKTVQEGIDKTGWQLDNTTSTAYTHRVILLSDLHYTTELSQEEYNDIYNLGGMFQKEGASVASGTMLGYTQAQRLQAALADINGYVATGKKLDSVLVLGDLTTDDYGYRGLVENGFLDNFKTDFMDVVANKYGSCYALPGNHDSHPTNVWNSLLGTELGRQYSVEIGDAVFVMLDAYAVTGTGEDDVKSKNGTKIGASGANYSGIDVDWLRSELAQIDEDKTIFLCSHKYAGDATLDAGFAELVASDKRIVCMFEGHTHAYNVSAVSGVTDRTFNLINVGNYSYNYNSTVDELAGSKYSFNAYNTFNKAYAWGYQVLEWNDSEVRTYQVRNGRTYIGYDPYAENTNYQHTYNYEGTIENEIIIKLNK